MTALDLPEAVPLAYALADEAARKQWVRLLAIKGPVPASHGYRPERTSIDVDVLVEPGGMATLLDAFDRIGWRPSGVEVWPSVIPFHSVALRHEAWPCEIDVHHRFPGFLADPAAVFEELWAERSTVEIAGRTMPCTGPLGSALVQGLHSLRNPEQQRHHDDYAFLASALDAAPELRDGLVTLADRTGARATAALLLTALGIAEIEFDPQHADQLQAWNLRTGLGPAKAVQWVEEFRRTPWTGWLRLLWLALISTEPILRRDFPHAPQGTRGLWLARWWRLKRGLPHLPKAIGIVVSARRRRS